MPRGGLAVALGLLLVAGACKTAPPDPSPRGEVSRRVLDESLALGTEFLIPPRGETNRQHGLALHLGWTNPWQDATAVVSYQPGYGGLALYLNYRVRFGGLDR